MLISCSATFCSVLFCSVLLRYALLYDVSCVLPGQVQVPVDATGMVYEASGGADAVDFSLLQ